MRLRYLAALTALAAITVSGSAVSACDNATNKSHQEDAANAAALVSTDEECVIVSIHHTAVRETPGMVAKAKATARAGLTVARAMATTMGSVLAAIVRTAAYTFETLT
jgi:hypothetical protein